MHVVHHTIRMYMYYINLPKMLSTRITLSSELIQFVDNVSGESKQITSPTEKIVFKQIKYYYYFVGFFLL